MIESNTNQRYNHNVIHPIANQRILLITGLDQNAFTVRDPFTCHERMMIFRWSICTVQHSKSSKRTLLLSGVPDYFGRNKISSGGDLSHYSSASLY